ncbi:hypothetical protein VIGAN_09103600, partial [Vigna angularis var. angularis]
CAPLPHHDGSTFCSFWKSSKTPFNSGSTTFKVGYSSFSSIFYIFARLFNCRDFDSDIISVCCWLRIFRLSIKSKYLDRNPRCEVRDLESQF